MSCHDSSPNYIPVGINYNNVTGKATGLAEIRTLDVAEIKPVDGNLVISGNTVEIKTTNLILSSDVDVYIPGNLTVSGQLLGNVTPVDLTNYLLKSTFNTFSSTVDSHIATADIHFTSGGLVAYTDTVYPSLSNFNSHTGSGAVHFTSGSLSGYYAASSWVDINYTDNADFASHTGSASVHYTSGSLSGYYAVSTVVDSRLASKQNQDATLDAIANITTAASTLLYFSGVDQAAKTTLSDFARNILDDVDAATVRSTIGVTIGSNVQAYDATLQTIANQTTASNVLVYFSGVDAAASTTFTIAGRKFVACPDTLVAGDIFYYDGTNFKKLAKPANDWGAVLAFKQDGSTAPEWIQAGSKAGTFTLQVVDGVVDFVGL